MIQPDKKDITENDVEIKGGQDINLNKKMKLLKIKNIVLKIKINYLY